MKTHTESIVGGEPAFLRVNDSAGLFRVYPPVMDAKLQHFRMLFPGKERDWFSNKQNFWFLYVGRYPFSISREGALSSQPPSRVLAFAYEN